MQTMHHAATRMDTRLLVAHTVHKACRLHPIRQKIPNSFGLLFTLAHFKGVGAAGRISGIDLVGTDGEFEK